MRKKRIYLAVAALATVIALVAFDRPARGDAQSDRAMQAALRRGRQLFQQAWMRGGKSCAICHTQGPNRMRSARLKSYPKFDKALGRVVTGQQKINQMIKTKVRGTPLALGSADLNALEAYVSMLR